LIPDAPDIKQLPPFTSNLLISTRGLAGGFDLVQPGEILSDTWEMSAVKGADD